MFIEHLNLDFVEESQKSLFDLYLDAAEAKVEADIQQPLTAHVVDGKLAYPLHCAILIMGANLYENRSAVSHVGNPKTVPYTYRSLIQPYIKYK